MPLEHILQAMQAQAESEIAQVTQLAEQEAAQLVQEAETESVAIRARHRARVEPMLVTQAASLQNKAKLGALREMAAGREQLLVEAFQRAHDCLAGLRSSPEYCAVFQALAQEAVAGLEGKLVIQVDPRDVSLARRVLPELGVDSEFQEVELPLGGLTVTTHDGRVIVVNTIVSRLERARGELRGPVAAILANTGKPEQEWTTTTVMPTPA